MMSVLKIFHYNDGHFSVWLDTEVADHDGICLSVDSSRDEAVAKAVRDLEARLLELQQPAVAFQVRDQDDDSGTVEVMDATV